LSGVAPDFFLPTILFVTKDLKTGVGLCNEICFPYSFAGTGVFYTILDEFAQGYWRDAAHAAEFEKIVQCRGLCGAGFVKCESGLVHLKRM